MAQLSGRLAHDLSGGTVGWRPLLRRRALRASGLALAVLLTGAPAAQAADLLGTWHVLVHYRDASSGAPELQRWIDRIWVFERKGSKLYWTEYPIVVFSSDAGRFERIRSGQFARVLGAWEPDEDQLANVEEGLEVNGRGSKKKSLRGSDAAGWRTTARAQAASASIITFQENWSVEDYSGLPVFEQRDVMESARTETLEGVTRYETRTVDPGGNVLVGGYQRDGTREGTFTMRRSGAVGRLEERSQREIQQAAFERSLGAVAREEAAKGVDRIVEETGLQVTAEQREELVREAVQLVELGRSPGEVSDALQATMRRKMFAWVPEGANPAAGVRYGMPFASDEPRKLALGYRGVETGDASADDRRKERDRYSLVFSLPSATPIVAARAGSVVQAGSRIAVLHADGTFAVYSPVAKPTVSVDSAVELGDLLGETGEPDREGGEGLVFGVYRMGSDGEARSLRVRFADGSAEGFEPVAGAAYPGNGKRGGGQPGSEASP